MSLNQDFGRAVNIRKQGSTGGKYHCTQAVVYGSAAFRGEKEVKLSTIMGVVHYMTDPIALLFLLLNRSRRTVFYFSISSLLSR